MHELLPSYLYRGGVLSLQLTHSLFSSIYLSKSHLAIQLCPLYSRKLPLSHEMQFVADVSHSPHEVSQGKILLYSSVT